jgi:hypothetical protein
MTILEFCAKAIAMLNAQEKYFKTRDRADLIASKKLEKELRRECEEVLGVQPGLFK